MREPHVNGTQASREREPDHRYQPAQTHTRNEQLSERNGSPLSNVPDERNVLEAGEAWKTSFSRQLIRLRSDIASIELMCQSILDLLKEQQSEKLNSDDETRRLLRKLIEGYMEETTVQKVRMCPSVRQSHHSSEHQKNTK